MKLSFIVAAGLLAAAAVVQASTGSADQVDPFGSLAGQALCMEEAAALDGGDVVLELDRSRTRLKVTVTDSDHEGRIGRSAPKEVYYIDAHNRVVDKNGCAEYMPSTGAKNRIGDTGGMTSTPVQFPDGVFNITAVRERSDKFGPNIMKTDATAYVDVYARNGSYIGKEWDTGYAIHSNTNDFDSSRSWGCIIVREQDNTRIAESLRADRAIDTRSRQTICVRGGRER
jgi:hypothetical protein